MMLSNIEFQGAPHFQVPAEQWNWAPGWLFGIGDEILLIYVGIIS